MAITVTDVRKALEDMVYANIIDIFLIKYGETILSVGDNSIVFEGDPYDSVDDFIVSAVEAIDANDINIVPSLVVKSTTTTGFVIYSPRIATFRWQACRKTPKINFWTP